MADIRRREEREANRVGRIWANAERVQHEAADELAERLAPRWIAAFEELAPEGFVTIETFAAVIETEAFALSDGTLPDEVRQDRYLCVRDEVAIDAALRLARSGKAGRAGAVALGELSPDGSLRWMKE